MSANKKKKTKKEQRKESIIIIGDWFIDENWLVAKHNTYSSSHTGDIHYLSKHDALDKRMTSLCGVPEILESLRQHENIKDLSFIGVGVWNKDDTEIIQCMLCSEHPKEKFKLMTPYTIKSMKEPCADKGKRICPYVTPKTKCTYEAQLINMSKDESSTNRIIRVFEGYGGGQPHLRYRFDWQLPVVGMDYLKLIAEIKQRKITAIVIEDHDKGVITDETVDNLISAVGKVESKKIKWYIRSKADNPTWVGRLISNGITVRLKVVDHQLALYKKGPRRWRYGKELGRASLELLGELSGDNQYKHGNLIARRKLHTDRVAVYFDDNMVAAKDKNHCFNLCNSPGPKQLINIGRTSIFFASLIAQDNIPTTENFGLQCYNALHCAFEWSKNASDAWNRENLYFYGNYKTALMATNSKEKVDAVSYTGVYKAWQDSSKQLGILEEDKFQVWRGEGAIERYICAGGPKRDRINEMLSNIAQFKDQRSPKHPFNCLLVSSPGWGKSFLAKSMANHFNMSYMEFSLSQMASTRDLIDCFDSICSHQNRTEQKLLIFMDEVNCKIEGNLALGLLLTPIWDGSFIRDGKYYHLSPAVWIFASTEPIETLMSTENNKGSDFVSRLNGPIIKLDSLDTTDFSKRGDDLSVTLKRLKDKIISMPDLNIDEDVDYSGVVSLIPIHIKTEQVYLCVSLLNRFWGPISKVQRDVLQLFYDIVPINGIRSLEFFISKFQNVQRGIVYCSNVPMFSNFRELKRHIILSKKWREKRPKDNNNNNDVLIHIETLIK